MNLIEKLLEAYETVVKDHPRKAGQKPEEAQARTAAITAAVSELLSETTNIADIRSEISTAFSEISDSGQELTDELVDRMDALASVGEAVHEIVTQRVAASADRDERVRSASERIQALADVPEPTPAVTEVEAPEAREETQSEERHQAAERVPALVASAPKSPVRVNFSKMQSAEVKNAEEKRPYTVSVAADVPGFATGSELDGVKGISKAVTARMGGMSRLGKGSSSQVGIASIRRNRPEELVAQNENDYEPIDYAT